MEKKCLDNKIIDRKINEWNSNIIPEAGLSISIRGPWTNEEDLELKEQINHYGPKKWSCIAEHLEGRTGKQCRERYIYIYIYIYINVLDGIIILI